MSQGQPKGQRQKRNIVYNTLWKSSESRWAHFNVKLHFYLPALPIKNIFVQKTEIWYLFQLALNTKYNKNSIQILRNHNWQYYAYL